MYIRVNRQCAKTPSIEDNQDAAETLCFLLESGMIFFLVFLVQVQGPRDGVPWLASTQTRPRNESRPRESSGYQVEVTHTGLAGVAAARRFLPHVVLCDIGLPEMDGYGVAGELRRDPATSGARLIALSGYGQEEDRRRSREAGFDVHLVKPVGLKEREREVEAG